MADYLADSSVLLDIVSADPVWAGWSLNQLDTAYETGNVFIDSIIYAEVSVRFSRIEEFDAALSRCELLWADIPREALFLAGKAFLSYREAGGPRPSPLPDFFIGAHAAVSGLTLITRDPKRVRRHFPRLRLVCPR
jgi:predicted nucleic acid-binding protein